jgi:2-keto-4-pentenoate hydratase/2-oxohepta-3-ene-1,7-dioic acid hydratase in catechol pathway
MEGIEGNVSELDFFHKAPSAIIGDGDAIVLPPANATIFHHELELGVVIGKRARNVAADKAMETVFGYTILQDASARGILANRQMSFFWSKNWDTFAPIGPYLVTADEIPDPHQLEVRLWVNDELRQDYNTSDMAHRIPTLIARASEMSTLFPGDLIATGCNRQGLGPMQDGDTMVQQITGLGRLTTRVTDPLKRVWPHGIDAEFADFVRKPPAQRGKMGPPRIVPARSGNA